MDRVIQLFIVAATSISTMGTGCDGLCYASNKNDLERIASDESCTNILITNWQHETLVAKMPKRFFSFDVTGEQTADLRSITVSGPVSIAISNIPTVESVRASAANSVFLSNLEVLEIADIDFHSDANNDVRMGLIDLPSLTSASFVGAVAGRRLSLHLADLPWLLSEASSDGLLTDSNIYTRGEITQEFLRNFGVVMNYVEVSGVDDNFIFSYSVWLEENGFTGTFAELQCNSATRCEADPILGNNIP